MAVCQFYADNEREKDERTGAERYLALRRESDADVRTLSRSMRLNLHEIDPAVARA